MTAVAIPEPVAVARDAMVPEPYVLRRVAKETADTFTLSLAPENGAVHPFQPGQFSMLWAFGVGEIPISISGDPANSDELTYTIRAVGATTRSMVSRKPGAQIGVRGPFGAGWPTEIARGRDVVIVAGGIGLAPLRPVLYHVLANRADYGRLVLLYGSRSPAELLYTKELRAWARKPNTQVVTTVDYGGVNWRGHVGVVTTIFKYARLDPRNSTAMLCGPEIMMRFATRELENAGLPASDIYVSMERNMHCGCGLCGHCQWGPHFVCKDGPVFRYDRIRHLVNRHEL
jgi:NAD(P)H-flavin reductase